MPERVRKDITKQEAARRQIETAIRMNLSDEDAICVHVLASSAQIIVSNMCWARGKQSMLDRFEDYVRPEHLKEYRAQRKAAYNYFKHADEDAEIALAHFDERVNDWVLWAAVLDYGFAFGERTAIMTLFYTWFIATKPHIAKSDFPDLERIKGLMPGIDVQPRAEQKRRGLALLEFVPDLQQAIAANASQKGSPL